MFCSLNLLKHTIMLNLIAVFLVCSGIGIAVHIAIEPDTSSAINENNECSLDIICIVGKLFSFMGV